MPETFEITVNGKSRRVTVEPETPLLYILRNDLGLNGPKFGCGLGQCGACTVILGDEAVRSCLAPIGGIGDLTVTTLEGLGTAHKPHPLQRAFIAEQAAQCGYCINGMIMQAKALLDHNPKADEGAIRAALEDNLCRCGTHHRIIRAVQRAAREMKS
ncbi:MAG: (2Fe-2S)-binding protein [Alphaproteobacteria bacterium]|nr:(2Fe-2S)-binding protein [Alphaproteobacteria bacterium]